MKKSILLLALIVLTTSLTFSQTSQSIKLDNLTRNDYVITGNIVGTSKSNRVWILFIPIGGRSDTKRKDQAYKAALKTCGCDGIIQPVYTEKRAIIPLILISYSHHRTTVTGKGYRIKTDADRISGSAADQSTVTTPPTTAMPSSQPIVATPTVTIKDIAIGDKITFTFKGETKEGTIVKINPTNAIVEFTKNSGKISKIRLDFNELTKK